jgi:hypothetical protein
MDRGVIVGGGLIAASFLVAILLNRSAHEEAHPPQAAPEPPVQVCEDAARKPATPGTVSDLAPEGCKPSSAATVTKPPL